MSNRLKPLGDSINNRPDLAIIRKFMDKIVIEVLPGGVLPPERAGIGPCWVWTGTISDKGYGQMYLSGGNEGKPTGRTKQPGKDPGTLDDSGRKRRTTPKSRLPGQTPRGQRGKGRAFWAHRISWAIFRGTLPSSYDVHHMCGNCACVNPDHLELLERGENSADVNRRRGSSYSVPF